MTPEVPNERRQRGEAQARSLGGNTTQCLAAGRGGGGLIRRAAPIVRSATRVSG